MHMRTWCALFSEFRIWVPHRIQKYKSDADVMFIRNFKKLIHSVQQIGAVSLPQQIVQKDTHGIHSQGLRPSQFTVNLRQIESVRLPHFQFVDCAAWDEIAADKPRLTGIPVIGLLRSPLLSG